MSARFHVCTQCGALASSSEPACPGCGAAWDAPAPELAPEPRPLPERPARPARWRGWRWVGLVTLLAFVGVGLGFSPVLGLSVAAVLLVVALWLDPGGLRLFRLVPPEQRLYNQLLRHTHGDRQMVERLLEHERRRSPGADRVTLLRQAVQSWRRDNA